MEQITHGGIWITLSCVKFWWAKYEQQASVTKTTGCKNINWRNKNPCPKYSTEYRI